MANHGGLVSDPKLDHDFHVADCPYSVSLYTNSYVMARIEKPYEKIIRYVLIVPAFTMNLQ